MEPLSAPLTPMGARTPLAHPGLYAVIAGLSTVIVIGAFWVLWPSPSPEPTPSPTPSTSGVEYRSEQYGLLIKLPESWQGYSVVFRHQDAWSLGAMNIIARIPVISVRSPLWTEDTPHQDVPVMVFTRAEWEHILTEKWSVGAAPIPPSELARNTFFVFALPARYNYAFPEGFEEVQALIDSGAVMSFESNLARYCTGPATRNDIGAVMWPTTPYYEKFGYLGQLFTAYDCGEARFREVAGSDSSTYSLGINLFLSDSSQALADALEAAGFTLTTDCGGPTETSQCRHWTLRGNIEIRTLLFLRAYIEFVEDTDCIDCG